MAKRKTTKEKYTFKWWHVLVAVGIIVLVVLTLGWVFKENKAKSIADNAGQGIAGIRQTEISTIQIAIDTITQEISHIENHKSYIDMWEKRIISIARIFIGLLLIFVNGIYLFHYGSELKWQFPAMIDLLLTFNGAILLSYSFVAYLIYGSMDKFIKAIKGKVSIGMRKSHIPRWSELPRLKEEKEVLLKQLNNLQNPPKMSIVISS